MSGSRLWHRLATGADILPVVPVAARAAAVTVIWGRGLGNGMSVAATIAVPLTATLCGTNITNFPNCLIRPATWLISSP